MAEDKPDVDHLQVGGEGHTWCLKGSQDKKKVPFKCLTFPKSSRRAGSEYVNLKIFRWGPSEKIAFLCFFCHIHLAPPILVTIPVFSALFGIQK